MGWSEINFAFNVVEIILEVGLLLVILRVARRRDKLTRRFIDEHLSDHDEKASDGS